MFRMQLRGSGRGLEMARSIAEFARELGVDFEGRTLAAGCRDMGLGGDAFVSPNVVDWDDSGDGGRRGGRLDYWRGDEFYIGIGGKVHE